MRVLMFTQRIDPGHDILGFTVDWVESIAALIEELVVITGYEGDYDPPENVWIRSYGKERNLSKPRRIIEFERHCIRETRSADVAFVHMIPNYVIAAWPVLRATNTPILLWYAHRNVDWNLKIAHSLVDRVATATASSYRLSKKKRKVLGHGIDTEKFAPSTDVNRERRRLLGVGRIDRVKNFDVLVDAVKIIVETGRDVTLRIVGEPSSDETYYEALLDQVQRNGLQNSVEFVGSVPHGQIPREYHRAGVFLNASQTGSLDKTEVEAMATGTPVISSNDSYTEMIRESELDEEMLTFPGGDTEVLANRIDTVLSLDDDSYGDLAECCRAVARRNHDLEALTTDLVGCLRELN